MQIIDNIGIKEILSLGVGGYIAFYVKFIIKNLRDELKRVSERVEALEKDKIKDRNVIALMRECIYECYVCPAKEKLALKKLKQNEENNKLDSGKLEI